MCFVVSAPGDPASGGVVLTGDTVWGADHRAGQPNGSLRDYLRSLDPLGALDLPGLVGLPGHGPVIQDLGSAVHAYREHRLERLKQVRSALTASRLSCPTAGRRSRTRSWTR